ncbi:MAG TPA: hypothetical protein ENN12_01300 [Epsilonproteobacteria bacterium]|nr:hypothetical protein [Campylobacterota bacterium]
MKHIMYRFLAIIAFIALSTTISHAHFYYSYLPKKLHPNQLFSVTITSSNQTTNETLPSFSFDTTSTLEFLSQKPVVAKSGNDYFYTFYFKVLHPTSVTIPQVSIRSGGEEFFIEASNIPITSLQKRDDFCGVLATDMKIKTYQVSQYDDTRYLVTISLEALESNLEDMHLSITSEDGIEEIKRNHAKAEGEYFGLVSDSAISLNFTYYNTIQQNYIAYEIPLHIKDASVAGQVGLNPKDDSFEMVKRYTFIALTLLFLGFFLIKKDFFYFLLGIISLVTLVTFYIPYEKICVSKGSVVYILPTPTSTISGRINEDFETMLLDERGDFIKIEYNNQSIGWIKRENLCKN